MKRKENKAIDKIIDGAECIIIATTNGTGLVGPKGMMLNLLANLAFNFKECGFEEKELIKAVEAGFRNNKPKDSKELDETTKEILKDIKKAIEEAIGEEKEDKEADNQ